MFLSVVIQRRYNSTKHLHIYSYMRCTCVHYLIALAFISSMIPDASFASLREALGRVEGWPEHHLPFGAAVGLYDKSITANETFRRENSWLQPCRKNLVAVEESERRSHSTSRKKGAGVTGRRSALLLLREAQRGPRTRTKTRRKAGERLATAFLCSLGAPRSISDRRKRAIGAS